MNGQLTFNVRSGGSIIIDLERCMACKNYPCLTICDAQDGPLVLDEAQGVPTLRWPLEEVEQGGCVECLGCELDCERYGHQAVTIRLPLERFDEYLDTLTKAVVYDLGGEYVHPR